MLTRPARGVVLIGIAILALSVGVTRALGPKLPARVGTSIGTPTPAAGRRPGGTLRMDGLTFTAPEMRSEEIAFLHTLIVHGLVVKAVQPIAVDALFDQAAADSVLLEHGQFYVFAPDEPGHPLWVCPASRDGAIIGGGDAGSYQVGVGGDVATFQIGGSPTFGRVGDVLVAVVDPATLVEVQPLMSPAGCPGQ